TITSASKTVTHTYSTPGTYIVSFDTANTAGAKYWQTKLVTVQIPVIPVASFNYTPASTTAGSAVSFNASGSYINGGTITAYYWQFGDGNKTMTTAKAINHTYSIQGTYLVNLTVQDNQGVNSTIVQHTVVVQSGALPVAVFTF